MNPAVPFRLPLLELGSTAALARRRPLRSAPNADQNEPTVLDAHRVVRASAIGLAASALRVVGGQGKPRLGVACRHTSPPSSGTDSAGGVDSMWGSSQNVAASLSQ